MLLVENIVELATFVFMPIKQSKIKWQQKIYLSTLVQIQMSVINVSRQGGKNLLNVAIGKVAFGIFEMLYLTQSFNFYIDFICGTGCLSANVIMNNTVVFDG